MPRHKLALDVNRMLRAYEAGNTVPQVAKMAGCGTSTAWRRLIEAGCRMRPRGGESRFGASKEAGDG
jgi:hypothetical protein